MSRSKRSKKGKKWRKELETIFGKYKKDGKENELKEILEAEISKLSSSGIPDDVVSHIFSFVRWSKKEVLLKKLPFLICKKWKFLLEHSKQMLLCFICSFWEKSFSESECRRLEYGQVLKYFKTRLGFERKKKIVSTKRYTMKSYKYDFEGEDIVDGDHSTNSADLESKGSLSCKIYLWNIPFGLRGKHLQGTVLEHAIVDYSYRWSYYYTDQEGYIYGASGFFEISVKYEDYEMFKHEFDYEEEEPDDSLEIQNTVRGGGGVDEEWICLDEKRENELGVSEKNLKLLFNYLNEIIPDGEKLCFDVDQ